MKTVCKKLFSLMLVAILLVSAVPFQAMAAGTETISVPVSVYINGEYKSPKSLPVGADGVVLDAALAMSLIRDQEGRSFVKWTNNSGNDVSGKPLAFDWLQENLDGYSLNIYLTEETGATTAATTEETTTATTEAPSEGTTEAPSEGTTEAPAESYVVTFDANGGTIGNTGAETMTKTVKYGSQIGNQMPEATRPGYTLAGWYDEDGKLIEAGAYYYWTKDITVTARWTLDTSRLIVKRVINGDRNGALTIYDAQVAKSENLLTWLRDNVTATVNASVPAGYSWDGYWRDYALNQLNQQNDTMVTAQTVYVNFTPNDYTIYFNADGGKVTPTSKKVTFDTKVGTLPTPTYEGKVFLGWFDENGVQYTKDTIYQVPGDTTLVAMWDDEAFVLLKIYINGDTANCDRIIDLTGYITDDVVTRDVVAAIIKKYYSAKTSAGLDLDGLFLDATWAEYKKDKTYAGTPTIQIEEDEPMYIYVMVNNAKYGATPSTNNNNNGTADPSNPKTGDMVFVPVTMMLASAAAAAFLFLTKKRIVK